MEKKEWSMGRVKAGGKVYIYFGKTQMAVMTMDVMANEKENAEFMVRALNAFKLIASAPELLEACKLALELLDKQREECNQPFATVLPHPKYEEGPIAKKIREVIAQVA